MARSPAGKSGTYINRELWGIGQTLQRVLSAVAAQPEQLILSGIKGAFLEEATFALEG